MSKQTSKGWGAESFAALLVHPNLRFGERMQVRGCKTKELSLYCSTFCLFPFTVSALDRNTGYNIGSVCVL